jgi:hypothetical protein
MGDGQLAAHCGPWAWCEGWFLPASRVPARRPDNFGVRITSLREVSGPPLREHLLAQMKVTKANGLNTTPIWPVRFGCLAPPCLHSGGFAICPAPSRRCEASRIVERAAGSMEHSVASVPLGRLAEARRPHRCCIQALCFGDFHLGQQMKVTRPPGRDPARRHEPVIQRAKRKVRKRAARRRSRRSAWYEFHFSDSIASRARSPPSKHRGSGSAGLLVSPPRGARAARRGGQYLVPSGFACTA